MAQWIDKGKSKNAGGRPQKFREASRPITLTLPERILTLLRSIHSDRAIAIAKATEWVTTQVGKDAPPPVQMIEVEKERAVIVIGPSRYLQQLSWLRLVEIAPSRFLLVIPTGTAIEALEVTVMDMIETLAEEEEYELKLLSELGRLLTRQRRQQKLFKAEILLLDTSG